MHSVSRCKSTDTRFTTSPTELAFLEPLDNVSTFLYTSPVTAVRSLICSTLSMYM